MVNTKEETPEQLRYWMDEYRQLWLKNHNKLNAIRRLLRKEISESDKINTIKEIVGESKKINP